MGREGEGIVCYYSTVFMLMQGVECARVGESVGDYNDSGAHAE